MANETVIVGCKLPNGLVLEVGDKRVNLRGSAHYLQPNPKRKFQNPEVIFADSITLVDKEFWDAWVKKVGGGKFPPLKNGALYASPNKSDATARALETEAVSTGLEPLDPAKTPGLKAVGDDSLPSGSMPVML